MTRVQMCAVASLLFVAMTLASMMNVLSARKTALAAEGADLRTTETIWVSASLPELRAHAHYFEPGTRTFKVLDETTRAVAFVKGPWKDVPLHGGSPLHGAAGEALAGSQRDPGKLALHVAGESYRIVGRLGVRADSLLADEAILAAPELFSDDGERLRIDGPHAAERYRQAFPGRALEVVDSGVNRRTNVDVVTPFLLAAGAMTGALVIMCALAFAVSRECRAARVRYAVGHRRRRLVGAAVGRVAIATLCPAVMVFGLGSAVGAAMFVRPDLLGPLMAIGVVAVSLAVVGVWNGVRRWS